MTSSCSMKAMTRIAPWHFGHVSGSTSLALLNRAPFREIQWGIFFESAAPSFSEMPYLKVQIPGYRESYHRHRLFFVFRAPHCYSSIITNHLFAFARHMATHSESNFGGDYHEIGRTFPLVFFSWKRFNLLCRFASFFPA